MQPEPALTYKKIGSGSGAALKLPVYFLLIDLSFKKKMLIYIGNKCRWYYLEGGVGRDQAHHPLDDQAEEEGKPRDVEVPLSPAVWGINNQKCCF